MINRVMDRWMNVRQNMDERMLFGWVNVVE